MSVWRVSTSFGNRYTSAISAAKARANVAYSLRRYGAYVPSGTAAAAAWVAVVVPLGGYGRIKAKSERAQNDYHTI